jgi:hypothetical protein
MDISKLLMNKILFILLLIFLCSFDQKTDLVINTKIDSCEKYRNIKITLVKCDNRDSQEFYAYCIIENDKIIVPNILSDMKFKKLYESANYIKFKLLIGSSCGEQIIKL